MTEGMRTSEFWMALGTIALGGLFVAGSFLLPADAATKDTLLKGGMALIAAGSAGYKLARGLAKSGGTPAPEIVSKSSDTVE